MIGVGSVWLHVFLAISKFPILLLEEFDLDPISGCSEIQERFPSLSAQNILVNIFIAGDLIIVQ